MWNHPGVRGGEGETARGLPRSSWPQPLPALTPEATQSHAQLSSSCSSAWLFMRMVPVHLATHTPIPVHVPNPVPSSTSTRAHTSPHDPLASTHAPVHAHPPSSPVHGHPAKSLTQPYPGPVSLIGCPLACPCFSHEHPLRPWHLLMGLCWEAA